MIFEECVCDFAKLFNSAKSSPPIRQSNKRDIVVL